MSVNSKKFDESMQSIKDEVKTLNSNEAKSLDVLVKEELNKAIVILKGGVETFSSSGTFSFRVPDGVKGVHVTATGGGGGGGGANYGGWDVGGRGGTGGNSGATVSNKKFSVTPNSTLTIKIGSGGSPSNSGSPTIVGSLVTLSGGSGGVTGGSSSYSGDSGVGGIGVGGSSGSYSNSPNNNGKNATLRGGGGGGGTAYQHTPASSSTCWSYGTGGYGASGFVKIAWGMKENE